MSIWRYKSNSAWSSDVQTLFGKLFWKKRSKMTFIKLDQADLDSPRRELSNGGHETIVALLVHWQINFWSAQTWRPIQLRSTATPSTTQSGNAVIWRSAGGREAPQHPTLLVWLLGPCRRRTRRWSNFETRLIFMTSRMGVGWVPERRFLVGISKQNPQSLVTLGWNQTSRATALGQHIGPCWGWMINSGVPLRHIGYLSTQSLRSTACRS